LFLAVNQFGDIVAREFEPMAVRDGVCGTGFHAIAAEDASVVIDIVNGCIPLSRADPAFGGIFRSFDVNTLSRACSSAKKTRHAFLQAGFVPLEDVETPVSLLKTRRLVRIPLRHRRPEEILQSNLKPGG